MTIATCIGANVLPVVSGQLMEDYPMTMMYLTAITIISCSFMFSLAIFLYLLVQSEGDSVPHFSHEHVGLLLNLRSDWHLGQMDLEVRNNLTLIDQSLAFFALK